MVYNRSMDNKVSRQIKVGVFGGAFDPVHNEHVRLMQLVIERLGLERLVLLPSGNAPHKHTETPFALRLEMLRLATAHIPEVVIDLSEEHVATPTYSAEMLPRLRAKYGAFVHVIGGDSMIAMPTWHCPHEVMRFPHVVVARGGAIGSEGRDGVVARADEAFAKDNAALLEAVRNTRATYGADIEILPVSLPDLSSTEVRLLYRIGRYPREEEVEAGRLAAEAGHYYPMSNGVCYAVHEYIRSRGLYDEYHRFVGEVPTHISADRWAHTQEVALMAMRLNRQLHLPEDKVVTAALLHDCMKGAAHVYPAVPLDARQPNVVHAFNGAEEARHRYGVEDEDVLNAVRYHTTGRAAMSDLERLIYLADYCEATRTFSGAAEVREAALVDFDKGFLMAVSQVYRHVHERGGDVCPYGDECYHYYCHKA